MKKIKIGIVGATGYTGAALIKILLRHRFAKIIFATSKQYVGKTIKDIYPQFNTLDFDIKLTAFDPKLIDKADCVFSCLPHTKSFDIVKLCYEKKKIVIDLSADFRIPDKNLYKTAYKTEHLSPELLTASAYGLPELFRKQIKKSRIIGNPGCYPTCFLLGIAPIIKYIKKDIIVDSKSGSSGAGRALKTNLLFSELNDNFYSYNIGKHRHMHEMNFYADLLSKSKKNLIFTPTIIPSNLGIVSNIYVKLSRNKTEEEITKIYKKFYKNEQFIKILDKEVEAKSVMNSNYCLIFIKRVKDYLIINSAIDNIIKGASGQAAQNFNIVFGLKESEGLK